MDEDIKPSSEKSQELDAARYRQFGVSCLCESSSIRQVLLHTSSDSKSPPVFQAYRPTSGPEPATEKWQTAGVSQLSSGPGLAWAMSGGQKGGEMLFIFHGSEDLVSLQQACEGPTVASKIGSLTPLPIFVSSSPPRGHCQGHRRYSRHPGLAESSRRPNREALKTPNRAESRGAHKYTESPKSGINL